MSNIPNEPIPYMDVQTLWNDRRNPHDNPLASIPRRGDPRGAANGSKLQDAVDGVYEGSTRPKDPDDPTQRG